MILLFPKQDYVFDAASLTESMTEALGLTCKPSVDGKIVDAFPPPQEGVQSGEVYVELEELLPEEGIPTVKFEKTPRLDRDEDLQKMIDEIIAQDEALASEMDKNACDLVLTFSDSPAAIEAGTALAYILAAENDCGVLIPAFDEDDDTVWFGDAEDFGDAMFQDDDLEAEDAEEEDEDKDERR